MKPLAVDLCAGLGGWSDGLIAEGWDVVGFDIERHVYGESRYPGQLVLQNILTLDGRQFRGRVSLIVASPPCTEYSYMAMPWRRSKQIARALRGDDEFPEGYVGSRTITELNRLFDVCFRIGSEAECPVVVENVRGAQPWVGRANWAFGSFYLWGDVPALMPIPKKGRMKFPAHCGPILWKDRDYSSMEAPFVGGSNLAHREGATKNDGGSWFAVAHNTTSGKGQNPDGRKQKGSGAAWFDNGIYKHGSQSSARKAASAHIAKIPLVLARHIARAWKPLEASA